MPLAESENGSQMVCARSAEAAEDSNLIEARSSGPKVCIEMRSMPLEEAEGHADSGWSPSDARSFGRLEVRRDSVAFT